MRKSVALVLLLFIISFTKEPDFPIDTWLNTVKMKLDLDGYPEIFHNVIPGKELISVIHMEYLIDQKIVYFDIRLFFIFIPLLYHHRIPTTLSRWPFQLTPVIPEYFLSVYSDNQPSLYFHT